MLYLLNLYNSPIVLDKISIVSPILLSFNGIKTQFNQILHRLPLKKRILIIIKVKNETYRNFYNNFTRHYFYYLI
jgi:hypothetical protein